MFMSSIKVRRSTQNESLGPRLRLWLFSDLMFYPKVWIVSTFSLTPDSSWLTREPQDGVAARVRPWRFAAKVSSEKPLVSWEDQKGRGHLQGPCKKRPARTHLPSWKGRVKYVSTYVSSPLGWFIQGIASYTAVSRASRILCIRYIWHWAPVKSWQIQCPKWVSHSLECPVCRRWDEEACKLATPIMLR